MDATAATNHRKFAATVVNIIYLTSTFLPFTM